MRKCIKFILILLFMLVQTEAADFKVVCVGTGDNVMEKDANDFGYVLNNKQGYQDSNLKIPTRTSRNQKGLDF